MSKPSEDKTNKTDDGASASSARRPASTIATSEPRQEPANLTDWVAPERLAEMSDKERMSMRWAQQRRPGVVYVPSPPPPRVPAFPCDTPGCTEDSRVCEEHCGVLFVKRMDGTTFTIPYGSWECWGWYKQRIEEVIGVPVEEQRLIFAGCQQQDHRLHSGLQNQSTIHLVVREKGG